MIKLFRYFTKKDYCILFFLVSLVIFSVFLDLLTPEYMSKITRLVQTDDSTMKEILITGGHMLLCAVLSLACTICVGFFTSLLSARFSRTIRRKIFEKVESFGLQEIKKYKLKKIQRIF